uniref:Ycf80 n=1 Tax=Laurencia catarinensis TaxID=197326 RepID=UPI0028D239BA|nr:Ycf80 [Laurencia catarinensis]WMP12438.1 Ycf80 [Laurencia catarinensis]
MILFDLSLFDLLLHGYDKNDILLKSNLGVENTENVSNLFCSKSRFNNLNPIFVSSSRLSVNQSVKESIDSKRTHSLVNRNFWQMLVNKYWQETIFISLSNSILDNSTSKLKNSGFSIYQGSDYKNFLKEFSKDLLKRNIEINANYNVKDISRVIDSNNIYIKYKWLKLFYPNLPFLQQSKLKVINNILINQDSKSFPLFILINNRQQIVLAESTECLHNHNLLLKLRHIITKNNINNKKLYTGLFFTNVDDAKEYLDYVNSKYSKSTRNLTVRLVPTTINLYYQLLKQSGLDVEFRLIPDLKEISELLYKYRKNKNLLFDSNQRYGLNYFQGQPLYLLKPYNLEMGINMKHSQSLYAFSKDNKVKYETIFLNYETALNAWTKYRNKLKNCNLPIKPQLYVLNLETFLTKSNYINKSNKFIFIPSVKTYHFAKKYIISNLDDNKSIIKALRHYSFNFKSLCYRILWSLTTRQPITW